MKKEKDPFKDDPFFKNPTKYMRKMKLISSGVVLLIVLFWIFLSYKNHQEKKRIQKFVGREVVMGKDTLTIIDFSRWKDTYTLSNGVEVDFELGNKNMIAE